MKTSLKISLLFNLGLLGGLIFLWADGRMAATPSGAPAPAATPLVVTAAAPPAAPAPFRWSQLQGRNYRDYVKKLRDSGCPEATLRAIVTADMDAATRTLREKLEKQLNALSDGSAGLQPDVNNQQQALKTQLQQLSGAEAAAIADLQGSNPAPLPGAAAPMAGGTGPAAGAAGPETSAASPDSTSPSPRTRPATMPLVMQDMNSPGLDLTDQQKQMVAGLQQDFLNQVGGENQDPKDPGYQARWQRAQPDADNMLQAMLGNAAYSRYQILAFQQAVLENWGSPAQ